MNPHARERDDASSGAGARGRPGWPVDPYRLRRAILRSKRLIIVASLCGIVVGYGFVKGFMGNSYVTTAILHYEGDVDVPGLPPQRDVIWPVAEALHNQAVLKRIKKESKFSGGLTGLARTIGYEVDPVASTIRIQVGRESAAAAAEYVRLVTEIFTEFHEDRQARRLEAELMRIRKRIDAAERESDVARKRYNEFRERHGIADISTEQKSMLDSAAQLRIDSELAMAEVRAIRAEVQSLETQLSATPKTTFVDQTGSPERAAYSRLVEELASAQATLSDDHPRVQSLRQQVSQLGAQVRRGGTSVGGVVAANDVYRSVEASLADARSRLVAAEARQRGLEEMAEKASSRIASFSDIEGQAAALLADVSVNEALLASLRRTETAVEDTLEDPPSGFVVLDPGAVPEYPERNKMKVVVFGLIVLLTGGLALLIALRREFRGLAPLTPAEVAFWGHGPVLGATSWPDDSHALEQLVAGLDDLVPDATGGTLVVGASETESGLTRDLVQRMNDDWYHTGGSPSAGPSAEVVVTPPPPSSGPYPIGGSGGSRAALAIRSSASELHRIAPLPVRREALELEAWEGPFEGQALRRAARLAERVIVLVRAGKTPIPRLVNTKSRLGRVAGVGYLVIGLPADLESLPDRVGDVFGFWGVPGEDR